MKHLSKFLLPALALTMIGCDSAEDVPPPEAGGPEALYRPTAGIIPLPNNIFFAGTTDGTLNIPSSSPPAQAANKLDGWSTIAPVTIAFNRRIDQDSIAPGVNIRVFNICINAATGAPSGDVGPDAELFPGTYSVNVANTDPSGSILLVKPEQPLRPAFDLVQSETTCAAQGQANGYTGRNGYIVAVLGDNPITAADDGLKTATGETFGPSTLYGIAKDSATPLIDPETGGPTPAALGLGLTPGDAATMESVRQLVSLAQEPIAAGTSAAAAAQGSPLPAIDPSAIIVSTSFSTQSVGASLAVISQTAEPQTAQIGPTGLNTAQINPDLPGVADVYAGTITLPYYSGLATPENPIAPLTDSWCATDLDTCAGTTFINPVPVQRGTVTVPVLVSVPNLNSGAAPDPGGTVPVAIFQHGITADRSSLLAIADSLAAAGIAGFAIDLPLHGITPDNAAAPLRIEGIERNFDVINNVTGAVGPDGLDDPSGSQFINLPSLLTSRDNIRQAVSDLIHVTRTIPSVQLPVDGGAISFDPERITYIGHSLGGIVGGTFLGVVGPQVKAATLAMPGGGIAKLLDGSVAFGPTVSGGLAASGVIEGTDAYEQFLGFAQQAVDSADPLNFAAAASANRPIHLIEVLGDAVVPNSVPNTPPLAGEVVPEPGLGGTDPLRRALGLATVTTTQVSSEGTVSGAVCFNAGDHSSILSPAASVAAFVEMQTETATYAATLGSVLSIGDGAPVTDCP